MNPAGSSTTWLLDAAYLAAAVAAIALSASLAGRVATTAVWWRTIWRAAVLTSLGLVIVQISGAGPALREQARRLMQKSPAPASVSTATAPPARKPAPEQRPRRAVGSGRVPVFEAPLPRPAVMGPARDLWLLYAWMAGAAVLLVRLLFHRVAFFWIRSRRRRVADRELLEEVCALAAQIGIRRRVRVAEFARIQAPIAFGMFRPTVGVPAGFLTQFSASERDVMLAHELAHLAARDGLWYLLADTTASLLWWHPAVWWLRRGLQHASEVAADEASVVVENGPSVLAECLVRLGDRMRPKRPIASISVSGFRSGLGRRIHSLVNLKHQPWQGRRQLLLPAFLVAALVVPVFVFCSPSVFNNRTIKGDTMNAQIWKRSLPGFALVALLNAGDSAAAEESKKPAPVRKAETRATGAKPWTWSSAARIREKLGLIVLDQVRYDGLPLSEVIRQLIEECRRRDPDKVGINFLVVNGSQPGSQPQIDPATGLPVGNQSEPIDVGTTTIRIEPGLNNVRLIDVLEAIVRVADRPLRYTIYDYGVVFSLDPMQGAKEELITETFQVQPDIFFKGIESAFGIDVPVEPAKVVHAPKSTMLQLWALKLKQAEDELQETKKLVDQGLKSSTELRRAENAVETARLQLAAKEEELQSQSSATLPSRETQQQIFRELFSQLGIRLDPPRTAFFNELTGILMVRVNFDEMQAVRAAIETLGGTPTSKVASTGKAGQ